MAHSCKKHPVVLSVGIMAWNEEDSIRTTLESLFRQSVFEKLACRNEACEIIVVANACTDRTVAVVRSLFETMDRTHPWTEGFVARVIDIPEPGKANAWNRFVHEFSAVETRFICSMDADIVFHHRDTIYNLMAALERKPYIPASTGRQCKDLIFKERKTLRERLSLATSTMGGGEQGKICGQLYCLRASVARNLYLPRDLGATEDGFIKEMVCTDFLTRDSDPGRVMLVADAAHIFEAYVNPRDVLNNQKRQMIGQTAVHVLVEYLKTLSWQDRANLADTLRRHESRDPDWLKKLIADHLRRRRHFWQLFPGLLGFRFKRLAQLPGLRKLTHLPAACAGFAVTLVACARAHRSLRQGMTQYWPKASRQPALSVPHGAK
jgi:glycosyltransferase involved in cell wall biosynthesis